MVRAATLASWIAVVGVVSGLVSPRGAQAAPRDLGAAYRAYAAGDLDDARAKLVRYDSDGNAAVRDYALWLHGMIALRTGDPVRAETWFRQLQTMAIPEGAPFRRQIAWRLADCVWQRGDHRAAAAAYQKLLADKAARKIGDVGTAKFRIAESRTGDAQLAQYRALLIEHPAHPLASRAERTLALAGAAPLTDRERIERAKNLVDVHLWDEAVAELSLLDDNIPQDTARQRDYWLGVTLFKMRRRYGDAATLLLGVYPHLGSSSASAMFHGARSLSRVDRDDDAIRWYNRVVASYPSSPYAQEAQFLAGWLEFNRGRYREAIAPLEAVLRRYPRSKWVDDTLWFLGMSHYFLGQWDRARTRLEALAKHGGALEGGKGSYWLARIAERLDDHPAAIAGYTQTVTRYPFSWYALLSRARLAALRSPVPPFGVADPAPRGAKLAATVDETLARDPLITRIDALIAAGLTEDAGNELERGERAFLKRHDRAAGFAMLLDRYRKAGNYNRPWMLASVYGGTALLGPASDDARRWWENAYPRAYRELVEKFQSVGDNPDGYLYSIMRKESGFDPLTLSYADAQGLLQMIPATTVRVARELKLPYDPGRLYEPAYNIQTGSWYIGKLLRKFNSQIPLGAGSFNSGPRPVMRWIDQHGKREIDELVELVPYSQTREYMKKVTENFARYQYLYRGVIYEQPLTVRGYVDDRLTY